ncbi:MAG: hypothetical protein PHC99_12170, partial [Methylococcales bacterium]|nr:hypothetical protein [Methylococcales bacterium]
PVIKGTVGEVALGSTETFSVTIKTTPPQIYTHATPETELKVTGLTWTLTVPSNKAIVAGTYDVEAARNTSAKNAAPHGELVINLVCLGTETAINGACVAKTFLPTVNSDSTPDTTPTITGTVGSSMLATNEAFTVKVDGISFTPTISNTDTTWSVAIPVANALSKGAHSVEAIRGDLTGTGTITITDCTSPKIVSATTGDCSEPSLRPTVTPSASHGINDPSIVVAGTVGDIELTAQEKSENAFSVKVHNSEHSDVKGALVVNGINWTFTLSKNYAGTFDVDAKRGSKTDPTDGELVITDNIAICDMSKTPHDQNIPKTDWDVTKEGKNYYLGACVASTDAAELPTPPTEASLPTDPAAKTYEPVPPNTLVYCDDGGVKSSATSLSGLTIKRVRIANAWVEKPVDLSTPIDIAVNGTTSQLNLKYGVKTPAIGTMDISAATITSGNQASPVTLTGVTLTDVYVDTAIDYINPDQSLNPNGSYIKLQGGNVTAGSITSGMITAGTDGTNPVRGSVTTGVYTGAIDDNTLVKGRRIQGTLTNATIENAQTTTKNGETRVDAGTITSGTITDAKTLGTVLNATLTNATISNTNHCFSSGTVGSKGQLNWKEVVK